MHASQREPDAQYVHHNITSLVTSLVTNQLITRLVTSLICSSG